MTGAESRSFVLRRIALSIVGLTVVASPACLSSEQLGSTDFSCPSPDGFRAVSQMLERRCGTLDCHGDPSRTFRVYGRAGLRLPRTEEEYLAERQSTSGQVGSSSAATTSSVSSGSGSGGGDATTTGGGLGGGPFGEYVTGGTEPTSEAEVEANRLSACGIEPDLMSEVVNKKGDPGTLTLVRKPRLTEAHKGGLLWKADSPAGDKCLTSWIEGSAVVTTCTAEVNRP